MAITNLVSAARLTNANFTLKGTAHDNGQIESVVYYLNDNPRELATGTTNWHADLTLTPGTNTVVVFSWDTSGNVSVPSSLTFFYVVPSPLTLITNGMGTVTATFTTNWLEVGRGYTVTATPAAGWFFSNWDGTITPNSSNPLDFTMQSNMVLRANFVTNQFIALAGVYRGSFFPPTNPTLTNSGTFVLVLDASGYFSGNVVWNGQTLSFVGSFDLANQAIVGVAIPRVAEPLQMTLTLNAADATIDGEVSAVDVEHGSRFGCRRCAVIAPPLRSTASRWKEAKPA